MPLVRCERGHYYDSSKYTQCPHCRIVGSAGAVPGDVLREERTVSLAMVSDPLDETRSAVNVNMSVEDALEQTVSIFDSNRGKSGKRPVGWLVCVQGPETGRDYRLTAGRNFAGRSLDMDINLSADEKVHRTDQFSLVYDPKSGDFLLMPGQGAETYLNGEAVTGPQALGEWDKISAGDSVLVFVNAD